MFITSQSMNTGPPQNSDNKSSTVQTQALNSNMDPRKPDASGDQLGPGTSNVPLNKLFEYQSSRQLSQFSRQQHQSSRRQVGGQPIPNENDSLNNKAHQPLPMDLAEDVKGMYRLLDLISESGSNGCVDKVIIAQDSLKRFINAMCPGTYTSVTKVDFKTLDQFIIKPLGVYGPKSELVRLLRSLNAINEDTARLLLAPTELGGHGPALSSGLYIVAAGQPDSIQECYYVIYWPEDSTWDDSATSSVVRNRVTFVRYLTKMCDQVVALLSAENSASIVWGDKDRDVGSIDIDAGDEDRLFTFEVARRNEQEQSAMSRPGFLMKSRLISRHVPPLGCSVDSSTFIPSLLHGETVQGFWTATFVPQKTRSIILDEPRCSQLFLRQLLEENALFLSESLDENAIHILVEVALSNIFPKQCREWHSASSAIRGRFIQELIVRQDEVCQELSSGEASLRRALRDAVVDEVVKLFPSIERRALSSHIQDSRKSDMKHEATRPTRLDDLCRLYPRFDNIYQGHVAGAKFHAVKGSEYRFLKERLTFLRRHLNDHQDLDPGERTELIQALLSEDNLRHAQQVLLRSDKNRGYGKQSYYSMFTSMLSWSKVVDEDLLKKEMRTVARNVPDSDFLLELKGVEDEEIQPAIQEILDLAHTQLSSRIDSTVNKITHAVLQMQQEECRNYVQREIEREERKALSAALVDFIRNINKTSAGRGPCVAYIDAVHRRRKGFGSPEYGVTGYQKELEEPKLAFRLHLMDITRDDRHNMKLNPRHLPNPVVSNPRSGLFHLPLGVKIIFHQLLENERLLLVLAVRDKHAIFLERLPEMDAAIWRAKPIKTLHRDKVGEDVKFTYDESKRMLVVCASAKMQLYAFVFDETFRTLQGQGSAVSLTPWYGQTTSIRQLSSVCGSDEVVLVGSNAQIRIFSFITQQFRPASLQLPSLPNAVYPSPDGSCLLVLHTQGSEPSPKAYHWDTFGSTDGISLQIPTFPLEDAVVTSIVSRGCVFLLTLDIDRQCVNSIAINITRKATEVVFQEKGNRNASCNGDRHTQHNSLLDCHKEVWTRFPVLPAVKRRTITSLSERQPKSLTFITRNPTQPFASYFSDLIQGFVKSTRKPIGDELHGIKVSASDLESFQDKMATDWNISQYRVGEWLVDLLCLIPIHIAVCRENRFVPLADGVISAELERSLLGADVNQIVDKLSFGWYESIFQSYMASKPVKVVSSMGQQSVGKSFSLNHLVDTSFAGSAMRTTEGVWMSVTPTDDELIVALDFEGVDSVERSPQEDTLLVLFNAAISNLVLFRNNFAFGRDISGLFQSFQSSASVLDPAANPSLFQSTLVIIIKDVVESDKVEIAREFSLKFQNIVEQEQDDNFISRLHGGKLDIIPWPVIESKEFYKLFTTLKRRLDLQKISHPTAGEFLRTIKTLMAKLKANDWGTLSQTMAEHRAKSLSALLPVALATGFSETEIEIEPLKEFDTDLVVESNDTAARFAISDEEPIPLDNIEVHLTALLEAWNPTTPRQSIPDSEWAAELTSYLDSLVDLRVKHVRSWLVCNTMRFQGDHAAIQNLHRRFDNMVIEMKANIQICGAQCSSCHLLCIHSRFHEGDHSCNTTHKCAHICGFCECEGDVKPCSARAGHPGKHICVVTAHLCGEPCKLLGRRGCLEDCTKVVEHAEDDHMCSALVHMCGEPCALKGIEFPGGKTYTCLERCSIPSDQVHETHSCDTRLCPSTCALCKRLCDKQHLHGLTPGTHHLCGEAHSCSALCSNTGICQIDTAPQSIEATFTGRHETFQYTKYTQVAKRLQCVSTIPSGQMSHEGPHAHSKESQPFHFCEARCENCSYFCTLPLGHAQQEHETSHGSMTRTRWAVDGPDGTSLELGGRNFSANDEGAPMMCNLFCSSMGRHVHINYCRAEEGGPCDGDEVQHINERMTPSPNKSKDFITHRLYWRRMGFKDPYTRDEQTIFAKCDAMCPGQEHLGTPASTGQPSYCTLPIFHPARNPTFVNGLGYTSNDGHLFECNNPVVMERAYHVIFVIDRSSSMSLGDRRPLADGPMTDRIRRSADDRLGAVYSALYSFWHARHAATAAGPQTIGARRDAYSIILFSRAAINVLSNDFTSSPDQLLNFVLAWQTDRGTKFTAALRAGQAVMEQYWSTERTPVMIFLSDGEGSVSDTTIQDLCRSAVRLGKPLSFHSVSFGPDSSSSTLRRMTQLALEIQNNASSGSRTPQGASVPSSFTEALDTVRLAETFLGIAESLRKPRGALMC